jgi:hypothetical protein
VLEAQAERLQEAAAELRAQQGWASSAAELLEAVHRAARAARQAQQHDDPDPAPLARFAALHAQFASLKAAPSDKSSGGDGGGGGGGVLQWRDLELDSATTDTENDSLSSNIIDRRHDRHRLRRRHHHHHHHREELRESQREAAVVSPPLLSYVVPPAYQVGAFPLGVPPPRVLYVDNMGNVVGSAESMRRSGLFETNKHVANGFSREEEATGGADLSRRALDVSLAKSLAGDAERRAAGWEHQRALTQHSAWLLQFGKEMTLRSAPPELLPSKPAKLRVKKRHRRHGDV